MTRSADNQVYGHKTVPDYGYVTLGSDGTYAVDCLFSKLISGVAVHRSGNIAASSLMVGALSSGTVTITDPAGAVNASATVFYILWGYP